jgi:hypothetical protein
MQTEKDLFETKKLGQLAGLVLRVPNKGNLLIGTLIYSISESFGPDKAF